MPEAIPTTANPADLQMQHVCCPLCGADNSVAYLTMPDVLCGIPGQFTIARCRQCRHRFLNPRPTLECLAACYPQHYGPHQSVLHQSVLRPAAATETTTVRANHDATHTSSAASNQTQRPWYLRVLPLRHIPGLRRLYYGLMNDRSQPAPAATDFLQDHTASEFSGNKLRPAALEIGCATGLYLLHLQQNGWAVTGIEPGEQAAKAAQDAGLNVILGTLDTCSVPEQHFALAAAWMVLEHVPDPRTTLAQLFGALRPGGRLYFSVPNAGCWESRFFGRNWYAWEPPRHLQHFTPRSIRQLLQDIGFQNISITHQRNVSYIVGSIGLALLSWFPRSLTGQWLLHYPNQPRTLVQLLLSPLAHLLALAGQGGRLTITAQRPETTAAGGSP